MYPPEPGQLPWLSLSTRKITILAIGGMIALVVFAFMAPSALFPPYPLVACVVKADPVVPGRAYAEFELIQYKSCADVQSSSARSFPGPLVYETNDYGQ